MFDNIRTIIINYRTPDLLKVAVGSFRNFYPDVKMTIIDNGSGDISTAVIKEIKDKAPRYTDECLIEKNIYHGPAMHRAMIDVKEDLVFFLDSDTETNKSGFLEAMQEELYKSDSNYAAGRYLTVSKRGFPKETGITVVVPAYMMVRRKMYSRLEPFEHHGMPVLKNFKSAQENGYNLISFPIEEYIEHRWRGTASRFGYGLGWRGKLDFALNKIGL